MRCFWRRTTTMGKQWEGVQFSKPKWSLQAPTPRPSPPPDALQTERPLRFPTQLVSVQHFFFIPNSFCSCSSFIQSQIFTECLRCARPDSDNPELLFSSVLLPRVTRRSLCWNFERLPIHGSYLLFIAPLLRSLDHQICFKQSSNSRRRGETLRERARERAWGLFLPSLPALSSLLPGSSILHNVTFQHVLMVCISVDHPQLFHSFSRTSFVFSLKRDAGGTIHPKRHLRVSACSHGGISATWGTLTC